MPLSRNAPATFATGLIALSLSSASLSTGCVFRQSDERVNLSSEDSTITLDLGTRHQRVRGFGASSAWTAPFMTEERADEFFDAETGIGLSLLRIQIKPDGTSTELETVDLAVERGVDVWAAPWSPPAEWKDNGSTINGGSLLKEHYQDWADSLADFALMMDERGTPLMGISAQNEPDYTAAWDTCRYTPEDLASFVGDYLGPALNDRDVEAQVIAPEAANWNSIARYTAALYEHPEAADYILAYGTHAYAGAPFLVTDIAKAGDELWQTEISDPQQDTPDTGMASALRVAEMMHDDLTIAQVTAWHYWWLHARGDVDDTNAALSDRDFELTKRAYVMGQYSKFVRPGFRRVSVTVPSGSGLLATAYTSRDESSLVLVFIHEGRDELEQTLQLPNGAHGRAQVWVTDETRSLEKVGEPQIEDDELRLVLAEKSVTSVVIPLDN